MRKLIVVLMTIITLSVCLVGIAQSDVQDLSVKYVDYSKENAFEYERIDARNSVSYMPVGAEAKYGLIFYIGTAIPYENYDYLAEPLVRAGYVVVLPKVPMGLAYMLYEETERAFSRYPTIQFFVGGHSQGGGAAVRRAQENLDRVKGVVLYAPLCYMDDTIKNSNLPVLLLEATNDGVLTGEMKADAKTRLPVIREEHMIEGCHMSFSTMDDDSVLSTFFDGPASEDVKREQKEKTVKYTLAFLNSVVNK
ncbi:MAG: hypothetical protein J6V69_01335 [Clostridia bacterium]|nr:hypothetical protein [Clostridia bacterium]